MGITTRLFAYAFVASVLVACSGADPSAEDAAVDSTEAAVTKTGKVYWTGGMEEHGVYTAAVSCDRGTTCCIHVQWIDLQGKSHFNAHVFRTGTDDGGCSIGAGKGKNEAYDSHIFGPGEVQKIRAIAWDAKYPAQSFASKWTVLNGGDG